MTIRTKAPNLRLLEGLAGRDELGLVKEHFHQINRVIPEKQELLSILPTCLVRDAVGLMLKNRYSQLPVVQDGKVLGVFSFRSLSKITARATVEEIRDQKCAPGDLEVEEFVEYLQYARTDQEIEDVFDFMARDNAVLIGTPSNLIGILTPMDFLEYLYQVASPYVLLSEIELSLRVLIASVLDSDQIKTMAKRVLASKYKDPTKIPTELRRMSFDDYRLLVVHDEGWKACSAAFGRRQKSVSGKLARLGELRNDVFHFRRELTIEDHETLVEQRNWLYLRIQQSRSIQPGETGL